MAGLRCRAKTDGSITTGTTSKTLLQYTAPSATGARVTGISIHPEGTSPTAAKIPVDVIKGATGGTGTTHNPVKLDGHTGSVQGTSKHNFSAEPTGGTVIDEFSIHPQSGLVIPYSQVLNPGETIALRSNAAAAVNVRASLLIEE